MNGAKRPTVDGRSGAGNRSNELIDSLPGFSALATSGPQHDLYDRIDFLALPSRQSPYRLDHLPFSRTEPGGLGLASSRDVLQLAARRVDEIGAFAGNDELEQHYCRLSRLVGVVGIDQVVDGAGRLVQPPRRLSLRPSHDLHQPFEF